MSFSPYLMFSGTCREAMTFYAGVFGATDLMFMANSAAPEDQRPPGDPSGVMHSQFSIAGGTPLMASDLPEGMTGGAGGFSVYHEAPTLAEAARLFAALATGGQVFMPLGPTFWSPAFGGCMDRFGISWMVTVPDGAA